MTLKKRKIFFDEIEHRYTDDIGNPYTSVTTVIGKYYEGFKELEIAEACAKIGRNPNHPKYLKYKNKSAKQLIYEWHNTKNEACEKGTKKHNFFETAVRESTNYRKIKGNYEGNRIYTIDDIIDDKTIGLLDISYFEQKGIKEKYPSIFGIIKQLTEIGYLIYAEIGVYDPDNMICGLIDIILIRNRDFIILDWKTNAATIRFEAGYFEKDNHGNTTDKFINKDSYFFAPCNNIAASTGNKYSMQLSGYAKMVENFGFNYKGSILCHIQDIGNSEKVTVMPIADLRSSFQNMIEHHKSISNIKELEEVNSKLF